MNGRAPYWILDVNVSSAAYTNYPGSVSGVVYAREFGINATPGLNVAAISQADCSTYELTARIYHKPAGSSTFTFLNQVAQEGTFTNIGGPHCVPLTLSPSNVLTTLPPPSSGTDVYRVAVAARLKGTYRPVQASFHHLTLSD